MKTAGGLSLVRLMIFFLLVAITSSAVVAGENDIVLDSKGNPVKANARYFIYLLQQPSFRAAIYYRVSSDNPCENKVVAVQGSVPQQSFPVIFELSSDVVRVSTELNIRTARPHLLCREWYWKVADSSFPIKDVMTGFKSSNDSTFTIQKTDGGSYKIAFGSADKPMNLGLLQLVGPLYSLILSNNAGFDVSFVPAFS